MSRTIECPRCGIRVQSKFTTDPNKVPRRVGWLGFCPVCGVRLSLVRDERGGVRPVRGGDVCLHQVNPGLLRASPCGG